MASRFWVGGTGTWDNSDTTHWAASTGAAGGQSVPSSADTVTFDGSSGGGTVTVAATINGSNTVQSITAGAFTGTLTFATNNPNITTTSTFSITGAGTRTITLGSGTFTMAGTSSWDAGTTTGLTFSGASSTLAFAPTSSNGQIAFNTGGLTYGTVSFTNGSAAATALNFSNASATIGTLSVTAPAMLQFNSSMTITNALNLVGTAANPIMLQNPTSFGSATSLTLSAAGTATWVIIRGLTFVTNALTATNSLSLGQVTNATISNPSVGSSGVIGS